ncbi:MAG: translation initiation factor IF-2 [bacterium]
MRQILRVYELAKKINISSKVLIQELKEMNIDISSHMNLLDEEIINKFLHSKVKKREKTIIKKRNIIISEGITVAELSEKINITPTELIKKFLSLGEMVTINQSLDIDVATMIVNEYGYETIISSLYGEELLLPEEKEEDESLKTKRAPIVTVMGHVDHGKTSLLDAIKKTNVAGKEFGKITQHIGAYEVIWNNKKIVFLDTPGHEAFTSLRARGAKLTDIVVLVVAADEGVMPQTIEAIDHIKEANVPVIVAVNKIDKIGANTLRIQQDLSKYGYIPEVWGGKTMFMEISAKQNIGIDKLLEMILLETDMLELKANFNKLAKGIVIEAQLDKRLGFIATVLIQEGTLKMEDSFLIGNYSGKIRKMLNDKKESIKIALPSTPVEIVGLDGIPSAGDIFQVIKDEKLIRQIANKRQEIQRQKDRRSMHKLSLDELHKKIELGEIKELKLIIKGDVLGSLEALAKSLTELNNEIKINIIHQATGGINNSDVMLASVSNAIIIGFNVKPFASAQEIAKKEIVDIRLYQVIYDVISDVKAAIKGMLAPKYKEIILGQSLVKELFNVSEIGLIAGCLVQKGKILRNSNVRVIRQNIIVYTGKIDTLKRFKEDVKEVLLGLECGIKIENFNDLKQDDIIESYIMEEIKR